jgi:Gram-negative porin
VWTHYPRRDCHANGPRGQWHWSGQARAGHAVQLCAPLLGWRCHGRQRLAIWRGNGRYGRIAGEISNNGTSGASGQSSLQTLFVRRAFTYLAGDQWGLVRLGQADGLISLFDNGVTTFQYLPTNNLQNGDDFAMLTPTNSSVSFFFVSGSGSEYANTKAVYLSPQFAGFDFGIRYAPNTSNGFGIGGNNHNALAFLHLASSRLMLRKLCNPS